MEGRGIMLRNQNQDFNGYKQEFPGSFEPPVYTPPKMPNQLDPKDERLLELSQEVGKLYGVNDLLQEDNVRLETEVRQLRRENKQLERANRELEESEHNDTGARTLVEAIRTELKNSKVKKGK
jgi:hypothetical protein